MSKVGGIVRRCPSRPLKIVFFQQAAYAVFSGPSMTITRSDSKNTVRSRASRSAHGVLCVAVFVVTVVNVNRLGSRQDDGQADGVAATRSATATVFQQFPANGPPGLTRPSQADVEKEIVGTANLRRVLGQEDVANISAEMIERLGQTLQVSLSSGSSADTLEVSITSADSEPRRAARVVNTLARLYVDDQNAKLVSLAGQSGRDARDAAEAAGREFFEAQARFHRFLESHFREHSDRAGRTRIWPTRQVSFPPEPQAAESESRPGMVENPDWSEMARRLSVLAEQKDELLADRTLLHPEVRAMEKKIVDCRQALEQIPRHVAGPLPETLSGSQPLPESSPPDSVDGPPAMPGQTSQDHEAAVRDFHLYKVAVDNATEAYERLSLEERKAWQRQYALPGMELQLARVEENLQAAGPSLGTMPVALMVALAVTVGVGMIVSGLGNDPTLDTPEQVTASLPIPVVGIVPAVNPGAMEANRRQSNQLSGLALVGYGVGLLFVGALILLTAYG